jgi:pantothenate kinase
MQVATLAATIQKQASDASRFMVAIAGPPASGKSTLAHSLMQALQQARERAAVVSIDGFHYDDSVLKDRGLLPRKGSPRTFDFAGFRHLVERIRTGEADVAVPVFDRSMELSRAGATIVGEDTRIVLVEGNYLLLDEEPWNTLDGLFDFSIYLDVSREVLKQRLLDRWGHLPNGREKIETNDLPNAERVQNRRRPADVVVT